MSLLVVRVSGRVRIYFMGRVWSVEYPKEGGRIMAIDVKQFELDRITNMLRSFGWSVVKSEIQADKVIVTMEKIVKPEGVKP